MLLEWALLLVFPALMIFAGAFDLLTMTIPNKVSLGLVAGFLCLAPFVGFGWETFGLHVGLGAAMLAIAVAMFAMGWIGGGDAKVFAAASLWMGPAYILDFAVMAAILGGVLTLVIIGLRSVPIPAGLAGQSWLTRLHEANRGIPYGIALSVAALIIYPDTVWLHGAA